MPKDDPYDTWLRVRCESALKRRLKAIAKKDGRKTSDLIRTVLTRFVEREEQALERGKQPGHVLQEMATPYGAQN